MKKILFVCTGDTCRSPMAEAIMKDKINKKGIINVQVESAGICINSDETKINKNAEYALDILGIQGIKHKARQIDESMISNFDYILTMTYGHKVELMKHFVNATNIFCIAEFISGVDVFDPYGKSKDEYINTARYLDFATDQIMEILYKKGELKWL